MDKQAKPNSEPRDSGEPIVQVWDTPELRVYGNVQQLTQGNPGRLDTDGSSVT